MYVYVFACICVCLHVNVCVRARASVHVFACVCECVLWGGVALEGSSLSGWGPHCFDNSWQHASELLAHGRQWTIQGVKICA